jgi:hypothetical protein
MKSIKNIRFYEIKAYAKYYCFVNIKAGINILKRLPLLKLVEWIYALTTPAATPA